MTSGGEKCGLSSLLPMSCRERAEAFARHLHSRLTSLGSEDGDSIVNENSWLGGPDNSLTVSQPKLTSESELYVNFNTLESPGSPEVELDGVEFERLINKDNLILYHQFSVSEGNELSNGSNTTSNERQCSICEENELLNEENELSKGINTTPDERQCSIFEEKELSNGVNATLIESDSSDETFCDTQSDLNLQNETEKCNGLLEDDVCNQLTEIQLIETTDATNINGNDTYPFAPIVFEELLTECPTSDDNTQSQDLHEPCKNCLRIDDEDDLERIPRVRRSSSLKTGKTPPGTPGQKKIVRFADVLGLDLADVRTFLDEIPKVPNSAYFDLKDADFKTSASDSMLNANMKVDSLQVDRILMPLFEQPGGQPNFIDRLRECQVCLDSAMVDDNVALSIRGIVRVKNLDFHKSVHIRYTLDSWQSFADVQAVYVDNSCDGFSDKFSFLLYGNSLKVGQKLEFAVRFQCKGCQYWDNNHDKNYCFRCLPATNNISCAPAIVCDESWANFYY